MIACVGMKRGLSMRSPGHGVNQHGLPQQYGGGGCDSQFYCLTSDDVHVPCGTHGTQLVLEVTQAEIKIVHVRLERRQTHHDPLYEATFVTSSCCLLFEIHKRPPHIYSAVTWVSVAPVVSLSANTGGSTPWPRRSAYLLSAYEEFECVGSSVTWLQSKPMKTQSGWLTHLAIVRRGRRIHGHIGGSLPRSHDSGHSIHKASTSGRIASTISEICECTISWLFCRKK
jgi:hypothetical protein